MLSSDGNKMVIKSIGLIRERVQISVGNPIMGNGTD